MIHDDQFGELEGLTKQTFEKNSQWVKFILLLKSAVKANILPKKSLQGSFEHYYKTNIFKSWNLSTIL